jgi:hypothetical protein
LLLVDAGLAELEAAAAAGLLLAVLVPPMGAKKCSIFLGLSLSLVVRESARWLGLSGEEGMAREVDARGMTAGGGGGRREGEEEEGQAGNLKEEEEEEVDAAAVEEDAEAEEAAANGVTVCSGTEAAGDATAATGASGSSGFHGCPSTVTKRAEFTG